MESPNPIMDLNPSRFTELLVRANHIDPDDFKGWAFCPGMLFHSTAKWWGDHGRRDFPHEGVDLCLYSDAAGRIVRLKEGIQIPALHDGVVRAFWKDYLGQAVIIEHENVQNGRAKFLSVYAHTNPRDDIRPGVIVKEGDIIAGIADTRRAKTKILPHLHLSLGRPSPDLIYEPFQWNKMRDPDQVVLLNPLDIIDGSVQVLDSNHFRCS